jgi:hypothetical protein
MKDPKPGGIYNKLPLNSPIETVANGLVGKLDTPKSNLSSQLTILRACWGAPIKSHPHRIFIKSLMIYG